MKKKIRIAIMSFAVIGLIALNVYMINHEKDFSAIELMNLEALATETGSNYSCSVSSNCYSFGSVSGSVSCTGDTCSRSSGGAFSKPWVECDGKRITC